MARLEILQFPDPRLRTIAAPVEQFDAELAQLADDMIESMYGAAGIGLAATQVNRHVRMLVLDVSEAQDTPRIYVNPEIVSSEGTQVCEEGCLSVPGTWAEVSRASQVTVRAVDPFGEPFEETVDGTHAVCLQHEIDHLNGKLFVDYLSPLKRNLVRRKLEKQRRQASRDTARAAL
jgi:peptide deformylase